MNKLMEVQESIALTINESKIGKILKVIIDSETPEYYIGRTEFDSPDVDGEVLITKNKQLEIGDFYQVKITDSDMYDIYGETL